MPTDFEDEAEIEANSPRFAEYRRLIISSLQRIESSLAVVGKDVATLNVRVSVLEKEIITMADIEKRLNAVESEQARQKTLIGVASAVAGALFGGLVAWLTK